MILLNIGEGSILEALDLSALEHIMKLIISSYVLLATMNKIYQCCHT